ncbi:unnamed protein product, partial [Salmonella enterica subsp. enterica serovar Typhimurium str. DT2]
TLVIMCIFHRKQILTRQQLFCSCL